MRRKLNCTFIKGLPNVKTKTNKTDLACQPAQVEGGEEGGAHVVVQVRLRFPPIHLQRVQERLEG